MEDKRTDTFVFVLMPFDQAFDDIYELAIKEACIGAGANCQRVDEQFFDGTILKRIYDQIAKADVIVADMSDQNPNVFYETGYAYALDKRVILLKQKGQDIPFDVKHYPHIIYEKNKLSNLKTSLERRIRWCMDNPKESLPNVDLNLELSINGVAISNKPVIGINSVRYCHFNIDIHNPTDKTIDSKTYKLALILPGKADFKSPSTQPPSKISEEQYLYNLEYTDNIFPFGWFSIKVEFELFKVENRAKEATLRLSQGSGYQDFTFIIKPDWVR